MSKKTLTHRIRKEKGADSLPHNAWKNRQTNGTRWAKGRKGVTDHRSIESITNGRAAEHKGTEPTNDGWVKRVQNRLRTNVEKTKR